MNGVQVTVFTRDDARLDSHVDPVLNPQEITDANLFIEMDEGSPIQGRFAIDRPALDALRGLLPEERARLGTVFLQAEQQGEPFEAIDEETVAGSRTRAPTEITERASRLLHLLYRRTTTAGQTFRISHDDPHALLWTESSSGNEIKFFLDYLLHEELVKAEHFADESMVSLTVEGIHRITAEREAVDSSQAFVAMWFDPKVKPLFTQGLKPAIEAAGYKPLRIDKRPTLGRLDAEIVAEIRRSRFMIADMTHGSKGVRGSVYYEIGYAHGLGLPVLFTCRHDQVDQLHFDIRQYSHLSWEKPEDMIPEMTYRIQALIGHGPTDAGAS